MSQAVVDICDVSLSFLSSKGKREYIFKDFALKTNAGEFVCLLGPSGCGKSSLLGLVAGFVRPDKGQIIISGKKVCRPDINRTLVFQEYALFPWLNVIENVAFGLKYLIKDKQERYLMAARFLKMVGLLGYARNSVSQLSGGMKQRVALARALVVKPDLLLMDEPFGALDEQSRTGMQRQLVKIWQDLKHSIMFVTHSVDEALLLADRIIVMGRADKNSAVGTIKADLKINEKRPRDLSSQTMINYRAKVLDTLVDNRLDMIFDAGI